MIENYNLARFLLTFFLGFVGSIIINHTSLKPQGYTSRTRSYVFATIATLGIYWLVASFANFSFKENDFNIGYFRD